MLVDSEPISNRALQATLREIGLPLGRNDPGEIAVSIVAQLIQARDQWRSAS